MYGIKGMGVRDLYLIKVARVGTKQEVYPECADTDFILFVVVVDGNVSLISLSDF